MLPDPRKSKTAGLFSQLFFALSSSVKMELTASALSEVEVALEKYCRVVLASDLSMASQSIYIAHAENFVRWVRGEFDPGSRLNPYPLRSKSGSDNKSA